MGLWCYTPKPSIVLLLGTLKGLDIHKSTFFIFDPFLFRCWDWWGFSGSNYALQDGIQMKTIKNMVDALLNSSEKTMK